LFYSNTQHAFTRQNYNMIHDFLDFFLNLDKHVESFFINYKTLSYFIICLILFCETGLVFTPFLPGDSLLFAVGATIAKIGVLQIEVAIPLMFIAVILGDNVNYFVGKKIGKKLFQTQHPILSKILKPQYLTQTEGFYAKYGGQTVIMARFVPIVRTFAPFVAGIGAMEYRKYITYCLGGGFIWVMSLTLLGFYFGKMDFVSKNFELVILGIIFISILPPIIQILIEKYKAKA
jgi:membrane-associated protein